MDGSMDRADGCGFLAGYVCIYGLFGLGRRRGKRRCVFGIGMDGFDGLDG